MLEICRDMKLETIYAIMLPDNLRAISLMNKMGFNIKHLEDGTVKVTLSLKEEETGVQNTKQKSLEEPQTQVKQKKAETIQEQLVRLQQN